MDTKEKNREQARRPREQQPRKTAGETPEEYLSRLAQDAPVAAPHLALLSSSLCAQLYGGGPALPFKSRPLKKVWRKHLRPTWQSRFNRVKDLLFKA